MPNTLRALIFLTIILLLAGSLVLFRAKYATAPAPAPQSTGTAEQWATFEHDFFPWVVRYPASWYVRYEPGKDVNVELDNFDFRVPRDQMPLGAANIVFYSNSFLRAMRDTQAETLATSPSHELNVAGLPAKEWILGSPPSVSEVRIYVGDCYYEILLGWDPKDTAAAQNVQENFDKILKELRPRSTPLTC